MEIRLARRILTETDLVDVVQAISAEGTVEVHEFTTVLDDRKLSSTVGFFLEINVDPMSTFTAFFMDVYVQRSYTLDPIIGQLKQKSLEVLLAMNADHRDHIDIGVMHPPTIRIVKPGTFAEYRRWKVETKGVDINQVKVPVVMSDPSALEWITERVVREL